MIETKDITKMVAHIVRRDKGISDTQMMHPTREWFVGLGIATLIVVLGSWFCWYIYSEYSRTIDSSLAVTESVVPYKATTIAEAIKMFETKQLRFSEIVGTISAKESLQVSTSTKILIEIEKPVATTTVPEVVSDPKIDYINSEDSEAVMAL